MRVHIEGMGITGSLLARRLELAGVDFTWHDLHEAKVAWQASTGAIYPGGAENHGPDTPCFNQWHRWALEGFIPEHLEAAHFVFSTKAPPHQGRYATTRLNGGLQLAEPASLHLNAQTLVPATRELYADRMARPPSLDAVDHYIQAHSWGERLGYVYWGWTRLVKLDWRAAFDPLGTGDLRPAFYFREGRFIMAYAYPVPGTPWWYAGSSIIRQPADRRRSLSMEDKYERWRANFERLGGGTVRVVEEGAFLEGWRPAAAKTDEAWVRRRGNRLTVRPLWNSGIRHFPMQWAGIASALGLTAEDRT